MSAEGEGRELVWGTVVYMDRANGGGRSRVGGVQGLPATGARTKPRGAARSLQIVAQKPGSASAVRNVRRLSPDDGYLLGDARELAWRLRSRLEELQEVAFAHLRAVGREGAHDPVGDGDAQLASGLREMIAACLDCGLASIERGEPWTGPLAPAVVAHVRRAASSGVSLTTALERCVACYTLAWRFVLEELAGSDLSGQRSFALSLRTSVAMGSVLAVVQSEIADAQSSEIRRSARSREQSREEIARRLLAGEPVDDGELAELDYELDAWHLGLIATGAQAREAMRRLQAELGCELLPVACGEQTVRAWLGARRKLTSVDVDRVLSAQNNLDVSLAVGEPGRGLEGWRRTHRQAQAALLVAHDRPRRVTRYLDVALEADVLQNEALADSLIETYLLPLDGMAIGGQKARSALRALFRAENNVSSAAHALGVHRSSVHRWRKEIEEERLGCRLHEHQADIELALRVEEWRECRDAAGPRPTGGG